MTTCRHITRTGMTLVVTAVFAMPGCGFFAGLMPDGEITPTKAISDLVLPATDTQKLTDGHFVMNWLLLGPFTFDAADFGGAHQQPAADTEFMPDEAGLNGMQKPPESVAWADNEKIFASRTGDGRVALEEIYPAMDHAAVYAVAWVYCPREITDARLLVGSDDYMTVWINGELVFAYNVRRRAGRQDQDVTDGITLKKGANRIVVKCVDVVKEWNFYLRFADKDFKAIVVTPRPAAAAAAAVQE